MVSPILKKIIFISLLVFSCFHPAHARVVGLVVDDSGSMLNRFETPLFAVQLVISVLGDDDRLFVTRLSQRGQIQEIDITDRSTHMAAMRKELLIIDGTPTPYPSVETMLAHIAAETPPEEPACMLVITDGNFNEGLPSPDELHSRYEKIRDSFKGESLQVFFVAFAPRGKTGDTELKAIEEQKVRDNLLLVFNGRETVGNIVVRDGRELYQALMDIISMMVGVDPRDSEGALSIRGKSLEISVPFTLTRLAVISSGTKELPAAMLEKESFPTRLKQSYESSMRRTDQLTGRVLNASVFHIVPWPPLSAGQTPELMFDRVIRHDDVRVLFETAAKVEWDVFNENGDQLSISSDGTLEVSQHQRIVLKAFLTEPINGKDMRIDFGRLPHKPEFTIHHEAKVVESTSMIPDLASSTAVGSLLFPLPGRYTVAVSARYPGFFNKRAKDLKVVVREELPVDISVTASGGLDCPGCTADRILLYHTTADPFREALTIEIITNASKDGKYTVNLDKRLPAGVKIFLPDGKQLDSGGATVQCSLDKPAVLSLRYNRQFQDSAKKEIILNVSADPPFKGDAILPLLLVPSVIDMRLESAGSTLSPDDKTPFRLKVTNLEENHGVFIRAIGIDEVLEAKHISLDKTRLPLTMEVQDENNLIFVKPGKKWFCDCLTPSGIHDFKIHYHHPETRQQAAYSGTLELLPVPFWERCWLEILLAVLALLILAKLWCLLLTHRFPRYSCVHYFQDGEMDSMRSKRYRLHRWWHWLWPFYGDAKARVGIFQLRAADNHVFLEYRPGYPEQYICGAYSLREHFEMKKNNPLRINWGNTIRNAGTQEEYRLRNDCRKKLS